MKVKFKDYFKELKIKPVCSDCGSVLDFIEEIATEKSYSAISLCCPDCKAGFVLELTIDKGSRPFWV